METLSQGNIIQQLLRATPENPVKLPIKPIEITLTPETNTVLYTVAGVLVVGAIISIVLYKTL